MDNKTKKKAGTFSLNKYEPIHNWYSYVEGYSSCLVENELKKLDIKKIKVLYDPFGGTGTTPLVASQNNIISYYSETNPFMQTVIDCKINVLKKLSENKIGSSLLKIFHTKIKNYKLNYKNQVITWDGFEKYFEPEVLYKILKIKEKINSEVDEDSKKVLMVALSSIIVKVSNMTRNGDLRYATEKEKSKKNYDVKELFLEKLYTIIKDIDDFANTIRHSTIKASDDARNIQLNNEIDCVITSPPYLNGTNYIRNTKLELKLNDFIKTDKDLPFFHSKGIIAGINNVSKRSDIINELPFIQEYIDKLEPVVYDSRITKMVIGYFNDMNKFIKSLSNSMKKNSIFIMDIGDSQFAGVHIPTHDVLIKICENNGFIKYDETILRERKSKNNMILSQRIIRFKLEKKDSETFEKNTENIKHKDFNEFHDKAKKFMTILPYKKEPFCGRNWGHAWHSLCSYHGKLKPAIAHFLIKEFTNSGDVILDPLCGVGTIPFEACLQGRIGIGNDLSEMAFVVSKAKLEKAEYNKVLLSLDKLENYITTNIESNLIEKKIKEFENFGFNKTLKEYFELNTFKEIVCAREYFINRIDDLTPEDALIYSAFLHVLHGNRPYALSRTSHSLTPYAPKGEFIYKNVIDHIKNKINICYKKQEFEEYINGRTIYGDFNKIKNYDNSVDWIICSPPFADSIKFYMQNWMRLWLCGWDSDDFKKAGDLFLDVKQRKDFSIYDSFFEKMSLLLKDNGKIILHLGKTPNVDMALELEKYSSKYFDTVYCGYETVSEIEKHGIKDKGNTTEHVYLFLIKKEK